MELDTSDVDTKMCVPLKTRRGPTPICIYPPEIDKQISTHIFKYNSWEPPETNALQELLLKDPHLNLIDIGANIGVYSLLAAKLNRKVVAVEANVENVKKLHRSIRYGNLENLITTCANAISNEYTQLQVDIILNENNIGGNRVEKLAATSEPGHRRTDAVHTIKMDDLLEVITFRSAILKIDIEGYEFKAFSASSKLFATVDVPYVFMEWRFITELDKQPEYKWMYEYFVNMDYVPYSDPQFTVVFGSNFTNWNLKGDNVFWKKKSYRTPDQRDIVSTELIDFDHINDPKEKPKESPKEPSANS
jgi:FkbM family methyltransferase